MIGRTFRKVLVHPFRKEMFLRKPSATAKNAEALMPSHFLESIRRTGAVPI
jgi:hypothetical protein